MSSQPELDLHIQGALDLAGACVEDAQASSIDAHRIACIQDAQALLVQAMRGLVDQVRQPAPHG